MASEEEIDFAKCEKNLNQPQPPMMELVDIIGILSRKYNVKSLSEDELHGLIEESLQDAYKKGWMIPMYFNPSQNKKSEWMRKKKNSPVQLLTEVFVKLKKMIKMNKQLQSKKISTKMSDKNFTCIRRPTRPNRIPTSKLIK